MVITRERRTTGTGVSVARPDGVPKVRGEFAFASDLWMEGMLWGHTLRAPHAHARIVSIDPSGALRVPGVHAVLTADDVPGRATFGLVVPDQPVLAGDVVRFAGEAVAVVAAEHPELARQAAAAIRVEYEPLAPLVDAELALGAEPIHPDGNVYRQLVIRRGDAAAHGPIAVEGEYEVGMQDQAPLGPEAGLAVPADDGGVELFVATQYLHVDREQTAAALGLDPQLVRLTLGGVGGAFGAREDISLQIHLCLLALQTRRPVKMVYSRAESFVGHVHRHPARIRLRHEADRDGRLVRVEGRMLLDGGAYASTSVPVLVNAMSFAAGPYRVPTVDVEGIVVRTNNPPCGAMRGFGAVQACFAYEAQMDRLAAACGVDPVELRLRNAMGPGDEFIFGQRAGASFPLRETIRACTRHPLPEPPVQSREAGAADLPGASGRTTEEHDVRRGIGFAVSVKNLMFSEGHDDLSTAHCRLRDGVVTVTCAAAEVGQGFVTLVHQIAHEVLGVERVVVAPADTSIGDAGSTSASRQTWMSGGAVLAACEAVRDELLDRVARDHAVAAGSLAVRNGSIVGTDGSRGVDLRVEDAIRGVDLEATRVHRHRPTTPLDADGQGEPHVAFAVAAHRAVVDVDVELGLVRVVQVATAQDVGRVLNPLQALGQIEGGIAQGLGLAVMEEVILDQGHIRNASFTDYLVPTALDAAEVLVDFVEVPDPDAPLGAKGIGEPPTISSTPAIVAAIRDATGVPLRRVPVRPSDIVGPSSGS
ncbi:MAG TPA: xanthine dehydrogenase subunit D [Acidimicrobiia bacterium]|nr:xanthine dehydrogenase subunit D [Acidimicrobiia bacterium]